MRRRAENSQSIAAVARSSPVILPYRRRNDIKSSRVLVEEARVRETPFAESKLSICRQTAKIARYRIRCKL